MRTLAFKTRMIGLASEINAEIPTFVVRKVADALNREAAQLTTRVGGVSFPGREERSL